MMWVFGILVLAAIGGIAVVAAGIGDPMAIAYDDRRDVTVPTDRPITAEDLAGLRFTSAFRGYRASEVDALLDRLAAQCGKDFQGGCVLYDGTEILPIPGSDHVAVPLAKLWDM